MHRTPAPRPNPSSRPRSASASPRRARTTARRPTRRARAPPSATTRATRGSTSRRARATRSWAVARNPRRPDMATQALTTMPACGVRASLARLLDVLGRFPLALLQLMFRLGVAGVFVKAGPTQIASWGATVQLFADEYAVPVLSTRRDLGEPGLDEHARDAQPEHQL